MSSVVLFDMDGTLTASRKKIDNRMINAIIDLLNHSDVGIVTGSGFDYLSEQCSNLWDCDDFTPGENGQNELILFPCNGTQVFRRIDEKWISSYEKNMRREIGGERFSLLLHSMLRLQAKYVNDYFRMSPLTGNFISIRGSLINWCPIGRCANSEEREKFSKIDKKYNIRTNLRSQLMAFLETNYIKNVIVSLGGDTSLDIYPSGWDKTHVFNHFDKNIKAWFVGDRCHGAGNDRSIYEQLLCFRRSFQTTGPNETIRIIYDNIIPGLKE